VPGEEELAEAADVLEDPAALLDGVFDRAEVVGGEDDVGGFAGDVGAGASHGDADVGLAQRGGVVDAVAGDGDDLAVGLQGATMRSLCSGATRANTSTSTMRRASSASSQASISAPVITWSWRRPSSRATASGGAGLVAGDHHHPDPARWQTATASIAAGGAGPRCRPRPSGTAAANTSSSDPARGSGARWRSPRCAARVRSCRRPPRPGRRRGLGSSSTSGAPLASTSPSITTAMRLVASRTGSRRRGRRRPAPSASRSRRRRRRAAVRPRSGRRPGRRRGDVGVVAQHRGPPQLVRVDTVGGVHLDDAHLVRGERAGLVRRDHARAPQRLDRRETTHQRVLAGHAPHADRERERRDGGQALGDDRHGEGDRHLEHLVHLEAPHPAQPANANARTTTTSDRRAAEPFQARLERGLHGVGRAARSAMRPTSVAEPVATTTPSATTGAHGGAGVEHPDTLGERSGPGPASVVL
jgi:hypothetical protein